MLCALIGLMAGPSSGGQALASAGPAAAAAKPTFSDVPPSSPAFDAIQAMAARGIMQGVGNGMFEPNLPLTRAQFAAVVVRTEGWAGSPGPTFTDLPAGAWYHNDAEAAAGRGAIDGTGPTTFSPNLPMTRAMVATLLARVLGLRHVANDEANVALPFSDATSIPAWAHGGVAVMTHLGVMGVSGHAFRPTEAVTRAETAVILDRMLSLTPRQVEAEGDRVAHVIHVVPDAGHLAPGGTTRVYAYAHDATGYIIPAQFTWSATGGTITAGGRFTAGPAGKARLTASIPGAGPSGQFTIDILAPSTATVSTSTDLASTGTPVTLTGDVLDQNGRVDVADSGSTVTFSIASAGGGPPAAVTATDARGVATATWTPAAPGSYSVTAAAQGLTSKPTAIVAVVGQPYHLTLSDPGPLEPGVAVPLHVAVMDGSGQPVAASVPLTLDTRGGVSVGSSTAYLTGGSGAPVSLTGTSPGPGALTVTVPGGAVAPITADFQVASLGTVSGQPAGTVPADQTATLTFHILTPSGAPNDQANGSTLDVVVTTPGGNHPPGFYPTVHNGTASFSFAPVLGGRWSFKGELPGYTTASTATLQVGPAAATQLVVDPVPTSILLPGQQATLRAWIGDRYGNPLDEPLQLDETVVSGPGSLGAQVPDLTGPGAAATFTAAAPGVTVLRFSVVGQPNLAPVDVTMRTVANVADKVAGKGMWLLFSDWVNNRDSSLLVQAKKDGITHLYLEVDTSVDGFYGARALDDLLRKAHAAGIAVIDWVYPYLSNPKADIAAAKKIIDYRTPGGSRADGFAADVEETLKPSVVSAYAQAVHQDLGSGEPFVGVVFPPDQMPGYPYASLAPYVDVWAPMDYWYVTERDYTYSSVYLWVQAGMKAIDKLSGRSAIPFDPVLQAFDELPLAIWNPPGKQLTAAAQAALATGAIGVSFYRWGTADTSQWSAIQALSWPGAGGGSTAPGGDGGAAAPGAGGGAAAPGGGGGAAAPEGDT